MEHFCERKKGAFLNYVYYLLSLDVITTDNHFPVLKYGQKKLFPQNSLIMEVSGQLLNFDYRTQNFKLQLLHSNN